MEQANREIMTDGFEVREREFYVPRDSVNLDPKTREALRFATSSQPQARRVDITRLLDEDQAMSSTLLQRG
jgi:hypothetical protein